MWQLVVAYLRRSDRGLDTADLDLLVGAAADWLSPKRDWIGDDTRIDEAVEQDRRRHFNRHRELWPDREYIFLPRADDQGPWPSVKASNDRLGRGEKVDITEREADDLAYFLAVLRAKTALGTPEADLE